MITPMTLLLVFLLGFLDRARGNGRMFFAGDDMLAMGWALAALTGHPADFYTVPFLLLFWAGEAPGWRAPAGATLYGKVPMVRLHRWQVGPLARHPWVAMAARGALWGAPMGVLGLFQWDPSLLALPLVYAVSMPAAAALAKSSESWQPKWVDGNLWSRWEAFRGWITGVLVVAVSSTAPWS